MKQRPTNSTALGQRSRTKSLLCKVETLYKRRSYKEILELTDGVARGRVTDENVLILEIRAKSLARLENWRGAVKLWIALARLQPDEMFHWLFLAIALSGLKRYYYAGIIYSAAQKRWPQDSAANWGYGDFLCMEVATRSRGMELLRRAVELDPEDSQACFYLGKHLWFDGNYEAADHWFEESKKLGSDSPDRFLAKHQR